MFSGLNLAFFSLGRMRLEAEAEQGNVGAARILKLRNDSNFLLCTILWGNVSVNVLLAMLSESLLNGVYGFVFSTVGITFFGEIVPQAYFSRHAIRVGSKLTPLIRFYQILLYPFAKPTALVLDGWIGPEGTRFMRESDMEIILQKHIHQHDSEIGETEGRGALNFLELDDRLVSKEGQVVDPTTIYQFPTNLDLPILPQADQEGAAEFLKALKSSDKKWRIITDEQDMPMLLLEAESYLCHLFSGRPDPDIYRYCHRPILVTDPATQLDQVIGKLAVEPEHKNDLVVDNDVILFWDKENRRIITGADILGRLLKGIVQRQARKP
ncbi:MAG: metal transporter CNNM [Verrucomicrobiales bacterium]|jgi:metal transporter CNNM